MLFLLTLAGLSSCLLAVFVADRAQARQLARRAAQAERPAHLPPPSGRPLPVPDADAPRMSP
jgi:hypothetical protein